MIDSHCHLNMLDLSLHQNSLDTVINHAKSLGVKKFLCVAVDLDHDDELKTITETYPEVYLTAGVHPSHQPNELIDYVKLKSQAVHAKVVAIGETGLDYHYNQGDLEWQRERFCDHIRLGHELNKPIVIHTRDARDDTIAIMRSENVGAVGAVLHCFTESWHMAKQALDLGAYISFSGIVTFKNAQSLQQVAKKIPMDRMLIETDCPYLTPVPYRGKANQPAYVRYVAECIAHLRSIPLEKVIEQTSLNCQALFGDMFTLPYDEDKRVY